MALFLVTFVIMLVVVAAMSVGVMARREPIKGSCGGLNKLDGIDCACKGSCDGDFRAEPRGASRAYRA
ncbi:(Na+)-NQR maturation NqrM [uncultured Abyssibacter sp.]|uniref:(Na+)-NQR maturation NqrM n=1 Tax=uncultured Abyssibacter sp. TaxID=2320202 RepID=UPI0032B18241